MVVYFKDPQPVPSYTTSVDSKSSNLAGRSLWGLDPVTPRRLRCLPTPQSPPEARLPQGGLALSRAIPPTLEPEPHC